MAHSSITLPSSRCCNRGFTLTEVLVTIVIVGILASIAFSSYSSQMEKTRRADGRVMLVTVAQKLERCYTRFYSYTDAGCAVAAQLADEGVGSTEGWYLITNDNASTNTFRLVATPQGRQSDDTTCANLRLTHTGVRDATGSAPDSCW